jgi:hypothetical protein
MKKSKSFDLKPIFIVAGLLLLIFVIYIISRIHASDRRLIPISVIALLAGVFLEAKRLCEKWSTFLWEALISFVFSFMAFLPGRNEHGYNFENHIQIWPYAFLFYLIIFAISFNKKKTIAHLTEGITLMQSIAVVYWVIDLHLYENNSLVVQVLMGIGLLFSAFSLFNAFTPFELSRTNRLTLSIWSCIIMVLFAADNIYQTYQTDDIEIINSLPYGLLTGLQFFLLGICSIYMVQNFLMLTRFLPDKSSFFNAKYLKDLKELKSEHVNRYSAEQVNVFHSLFCVFVTGGFFYLNYRYKILPRNLAIWTVIVVFPLILGIFDFVTNQIPQKIKIKQGKG